MRDRYGQHRNPEFRKIVFPATQGAFECSSIVIDLPIHDEAHRPLRGRILETADLGNGIWQVTAELELQ